MVIKYIQWYILDCFSGKCDLSVKLCFSDQQRSVIWSLSSQLGPSLANRLVGRSQTKHCMKNTY